MTVIQWLCLVPAVTGSVYAVLCLLTAARFRLESKRLSLPSASDWPAVTILKPVHGLEKHLIANLRSTCRQDYPEFQVVFSVQSPRDPAIPLLKQMQQEFGAERVTVAIEQRHAGPNGKINNLLGGLAHARHEILVISDSDIQLGPDYLKTIVAPLADPEIGYVCTLYKAISAQTWFEKMELLTINAELMPNIVFAYVTGAAKFCLGASTALRRAALKDIGGLESLADYLVEDYEMGRRLWTAGKKIAIVPYLVETVVDLHAPLQWWNHLVYWDQNNRAARPGALFSTVLIRPVPFALLFAVVSFGGSVGLSILVGALAVRLTTAAAMMGWAFQDREGLRNLLLLPFRDIAGLVSWFLAFTKKTTIWRGTEFVLTRDGRLVSQEVSGAHTHRHG